MLLLLPARAPSSGKLEIRAVILYLCSMYVYACPQKTGWTKAKRTENMQQVESKNCVINSKKGAKAVSTMLIYRPGSCTYAHVNCT